MDFTREPIIQTIITPKEGCKLVVRSSKNAGQEEYFVDAVEVVSFDQASFFRSLERPKPFLVPISDYEILEVREARMVLKNVGIDRSIKIGGGRESVSRSAKGAEKETVVEMEPAKVESQAPAAPDGAVEVKQESRPGLEKKRDRRRQYRKRRGGQVLEKEDSAAVAEAPEQSEEEKVVSQTPEEEAETGQSSGNMLSSLLQPPPTLISETINRYRENALFKSAFFLSEDEEYKPHDKVQDLLNEEDGEFIPPLREPLFAGSGDLPERSFEALKISETEPPSVVEPTTPRQEVFAESVKEESLAEVNHFLEEKVEEESCKSILMEEAAHSLLEFDDQPREDLLGLKSMGESCLEEQQEVEEPIISIDQPVFHRQKSIVDEKANEEGTSLSLFQEEDDEKFNERDEEGNDRS